MKHFTNDYYLKDGCLPQSGPDEALLEMRGRKKVQRATVKVFQR